MGVLQTCKKISLSTVEGFHWREKLNTPCIHINRIMEVSMPSVTITAQRVHCRTESTAAQRGYLLIPGAHISGRVISTLFFCLVTSNDVMNMLCISIRFSLIKLFKHYWAIRKAVRQIEWQQDVNFFLLVSCLPRSSIILA